MLIGTDMYEAFVIAIESRFQFLRNDYNFREVHNKSHDHTYCIEYQNKFVKIDFHLGLKDQTLFIHLFKIYENGIIAKYADDSTEWFFLSGFAQFHQSNINWNNKIYELGNEYNLEKLNQMIEDSAYIVSTYAKEILNGKSWFNWKNRKIEQL